MRECNFNFRGANFIVTGASSGIGRQITEELVAAGARVLAIARRGDFLLQMHNANELVIPGIADVTDYAKMTNTIEDFVKKYGKIHGGVHAAGLAGLTVLKGYEEAEAHRIVDISFWAGVNFFQLISRGRIGHNGASFVWLSSIAAEYGFAGLFAYNGSKAAAETAVKTFAKELAYKQMRINAVRPGVVDTGMTENKTVGTAVNRYVTNTLFGMGNVDDISGMVLFLLSDRSRWITGSIINVDGGYGEA